MLKLADLKDGEIYYIELNLPQHCNPIWIQKWKGSAIDKVSKTFQEDWNKFGNNTIPLELRLATDEEKAWLQHCIKEDKFVEYEEFMKVYKQQFIVGKWYKNIGNPEVYIAPFVGIENGKWVSNEKKEYIYTALTSH